MPSLTIAADCLLEDIPFALEKAVKDRLTIDNPKYVSAKKYGRWVGKQLQPQLKFYEPVPGGLRFPRGFANQAVFLCREILQETPDIHDQRLLLPEVDFSFGGALRSYQEAAVAAAEKRSFGVLEAGTGSGKTVMALAIIAARRQPTLIVVHTKELLYQWQKRIHEFLGCSAGLVGDGHFSVQPISVAIVNTARKRVQELAPCFGHLVVDECHRVPAALFTDVVSNFGGHYLLGLSATAFRNDEGLTKLIYFYMGDRIHQVNQGVLEATGAVVKPELIRRKTAFRYRYRGDYQPLITALIQDAGRNQQIIDDVVRVSRMENSGTLLLVSDRISHCQVFEKGLRERGVEVVMLTGQTPAEQRAVMVQEVQDGRVQVLVATLQLIGEGFDCSGLSTLFLTTPITFEGRLLQVLGRIMRPAEGKQARVFDYVDEDVSVLNRSAESRRKILASF
ncbi:MAG: DEAD/DEAH box helicase [Proteobacteria bacterium]|nr:DEAD/DEAH box helicase [Pseudomonadota bacterium]MBU1231781.1 DEAD/DEAH box helicase [Pseudomonadota bacterium]MBU1417425.1 DEAD/DEAH box helicase [Pseudomonadota bacterium]